jgi:hypothetical protein
VPVDHAAAWAEFQAWIAEEPNRGRQAALVKMAELVQKHTVPEDELDRALRLIAPRMTDLLFNRIGDLTRLLTQQEAETEEVAEGSGASRPEGVHRSMAPA